MRRLVLRTCSRVNGKLVAFGGFEWPESGYVEAPDWSPDPSCGGGLHGLLGGKGDGYLLDWGEDTVWLVVEAEGEIVDLDGKVKFPRGVVAHCGDRVSATAYLRSEGYENVVGDTVTVGDGAISKVGDMATAVAGDRGTAVAGLRGTAVVGDYATATAGYRGTATAGYRGTAVAGDMGTATSGLRGTATAGYMGTATAGPYGTATAGDFGYAMAGEGGNAKVGHMGEISIRWINVARCRTVAGYAGEGGIEANVAYRVEKGILVRA